MAMSSTKTVINQPPDVAVVVGSGENKREFQCHGVILAAASPVLDAMLSSGMVESQKRRIEFPDKDPADWEIFLRCIDPGAGFLCVNDTNYNDIWDNDGDRRDVNPILNESNVRSLTPLFHELQMCLYLKKCDQILLNREEIASFSWMDDENSTEIKRKSLELLSFTLKYDLHETQRYTEDMIAKEIEQFCWGCTNNFTFDVATVETLVDIFRPMRLRVIEKQAKKQKTLSVNRGIYESSNCKNLWAQICSCITDDLSLIPFEDVNNGKVFSRIIYYALQRYRESMESQIKAIYNQLPRDTRQCNVYIVNENKNNQTILGSQIPATSRATLKMIQYAVNSVARRLVPYDAGCGNFNRSYKLQRSSSDSKICMLFVDPFLYKENYCSLSDTRTSLDYSTVPDVPIAIRFREPDLTVVVGCGEEKKCFECHRVLLAFALKNQDSAGANNLHLPKLNPNAWHLFYKFIHPYYNGSSLNPDNAVILIPFFLEFGMSDCIDLAKSFIIRLIDEARSNVECDETPPIVKIIEALKLGINEIQEYAEISLYHYLKWMILEIFLQTQIMDSIFKLQKISFCSVFLFKETLKKIHSRPRAAQEFGKPSPHTLVTS